MNVPDPIHILNYSPLQIQEDLSYTEEPNSRPQGKIVTEQDKYQKIEEATWEPEEEM